MQVAGETPRKIAATYRLAAERIAENPSSNIFRVFREQGVDMSEFGPHRIGGSTAEDGYYTPFINPKDKIIPADIQVLLALFIAEYLESEYE